MGASFDARVTHYWEKNKIIVISKTVAYNIFTVEFIQLQMASSRLAAFSLVWC